MRIGEPVHVRAYKSDGTCYRWWSATVESLAPDQIVVVTPAGHRVEEPSGGWISNYSIRSYYWPGRPYSLLEVYRPDGRLDEIYVNINSPVEMEDSQIRFTDYELDVSHKPPGEAHIVDQDEFQEAAARYGYSEEFQEACYRLAQEALELANRWPGGDMPRFPVSDPSGAGHAPGRGA